MSPSPLESPETPGGADAAPRASARRSAGRLLGRSQELRAACVDFFGAALFARVYGMLQEPPPGEEGVEAELLRLVGHDKVQFVPKVQLLIRTEAMLGRAAV